MCLRRITEKFKNLFHTYNNACWCVKVTHMNSVFVSLALQNLPKFVKNKFQWQMWLLTILARAQCFQTRFNLLYTRLSMADIGSNVYLHVFKKVLIFWWKARENYVKISLRHTCHLFWNNFLGSYFLFLVEENFHTNLRIKWN